MRCFQPVNYCGIIVLIDLRPPTVAIVVGGIPPRARIRTYSLL